MPLKQRDVKAVLNFASHGFLKTTLAQVETCCSAFQRIASSLPFPSHAQLIMNGISVPETYKESSINSSIVVELRFKWLESTHRLLKEIEIAENEVAHAVSFLQSVMRATEDTISPHWPNFDLENCTRDSFLSLLRKMESEDVCDVIRSGIGEERFVKTYAALKYGAVMGSLWDIISEIVGQGYLTQWKLALKELEQAVTSAV